MFTLDASGRGSPAGNTVRKLPFVGSVTVTLRATAFAFAGTPPRSVTFRFTVVPPATAPSTSPVPSRVSSNRAGVRARRRRLLEGVNQPTTSATRFTLPELL